MKLFKCQQCGQLLYFENTICERCGYTLGFSPDDLELLTIVSVGEQLFTNVLNSSKRYRHCANAQHEVCNWLVDASDQNQFCAACRLNHTIPDLSNPEHTIRWRKLEIAKHRLVYTLFRLGLPVFAKADEAETGLAFDFLVDQDPKQKVISPEDFINIAEEPADKEAMELDNKLKNSIQKHLDSGDTVVCISGGGGNSLDEWLRNNFNT